MPSSACNRATMDDREAVLYYFRLETDANVLDTYDGKTAIITDTVTIMPVPEVGVTVNLWEPASQPTV